MKVMVHTKTTGFGYGLEVESDVETLDDYVDQLATQFPLGGWLVGVLSVQLPGLAGLHETRAAFPIGDVVAISKKLEVS